MKSFLTPFNSTRFKLILLSLIIVELFILIPRLRFLVSAQCQTNDRNQGLISAPNPVVGIFGNPNSVCVSGNDAAFAPFKIPTYETLRNLYFDNVKAVPGVLDKQIISAANPTNSNININQNSVFYIPQAKGDLTLNGDPNSSNVTNFSAVIFVDGNLNINSDIIYGNPTGSDPKTAPVSKASGLVFVVKGAIKIDAGVNRIDAVLMSAGLNSSGSNLGYSI